MISGQKMQNKVRTAWVPRTGDAFSWWCSQESFICFPITHVAVSVFISQLYRAKSRCVLIGQESCPLTSINPCPLTSNSPLIHSKYKSSKGILPSAPPENQNQRMGLIQAGQLRKTPNLSAPFLCLGKKNFFFTVSLCDPK